MSKKIKFPKIFIGWWMVVLGSFMALWGRGYHSYGFSALFKPITSELGLSRAVTSVASSIGRIGGGIEAPLSGWFTDRFGPKWITIFGTVVLAVSFILMNYVDSVWSFYVVWGVMAGLGSNLAVGIPTETAISNWFVKKRGTALSIQALCSGLGAVVIVPLVAWLVVIQGWRISLVIGGLVTGFVGLPLAWFALKRHRPEYYGLLPDGMTIKEADAAQMIDKGIEYAAEVQETEFTLRQAMKTRAYWLLVIVYGAHGLVAPAIIMHSIPFLTDIGIGPLQAAGISAIMGAASAPARFFSGMITDRVSRNHLRFLLAGALFMQGAGIALFLLFQTTAMIYVWFILYGAGMGAGFTLNAPIRARYFGRKAFGSIGGSSRVYLMPISMAAPIYIGWIYDTTGSYLSGFTIMAMVLIPAAVLAAFILPPKPPARITGVSEFM